MNKNKLLKQISDLEVAALKARDNGTYYDIYQYWHEMDRLHGVLLRIEDERN